MDKSLLMAQLQELPLYYCDFIDPQTLEFTSRVRWICENECPMYGKTWACPPGVGAVCDCEKHCKSYTNCLLIATIAEVADIADIDETLATRPAHEAITNEVAALLRAHGIDPYILSTEACTHCERCSYLDGQPCRHPELMHPCVESHGINILPVIDDAGLTFQYGENVVTWFSLLFFNE
ncbi:MAG: DUF2284 domain-containing protein [Ruminococcaceae bacterium]|nr:DUF2284 domain-containing protein [Oscillospiraceae bacterium]